MDDLQSSQNPPPAYPEANGQQPAHDTNGTWLLQDDVDEQARWDADASRVAARKAMAAKRQSRASMIQTSRTKSRRKAKQTMVTRPGITVDTSVSQHKGKAPRQLFPQKRVHGGSSESPQRESRATRARIQTHRIELAMGTDSASKTKQCEPKPGIKSHPPFPQTAGTLRPGRFASMEVSPADRPITIGLSIPSESLSEHEDYRTNRQRSESDVTLVTPNIIITPAALKSVWLPDNKEIETGQKSNHVRDSTIDSAVTAFEEDEDAKRKARVTSTGTLFEEDATPHSSRETNNKGHLDLSIDTALTPTPRLSRGWWNVITTPFELSRSNSLWTRRTVGNGDTTPDVPMVPQRFGASPVSASTPSTYIWSATEKAFSPNDREVPLLLGLDLPNQMHETARLTTSQPQVARSEVVQTREPFTQSSPEAPRPARLTNPPLQMAPFDGLQSREPVPQTSIPQPQMAHTTTYSRDSHFQTASFEGPPSRERAAQNSTPKFSMAHETHWSSPQPQMSPSDDTQRVSKKQEREQRREQKREKKRQKSKRSRCCCWLSWCCIIFLALVAIITALAVTLTRKHHKKDDIPTASQWLNLTGYPPMPTGMSTIAQPEAIDEISGCVSPATIWSCALPKEEQASVSPNKPDQPNFKLNIVFNNGTIADKSKTQIAPRTVSNPVSAGAFIKSRLLRIRDQLTASPAVPSLDDQRFLGNTTDDNKIPFEGEQTPFFISFVDPTTASSSARLAKRGGGNFGNLSDLIPPPSINSDGTAAAANLLPFPSSQPLQLYDRGLPTEHYGFYNYFDRSIFLKSIQPTNNSFGGVPADTNGGSTFDSATMRCTWAQTRFLVQIWTNSGTTKPLLQGTPTTSTASATSPTSTVSPAADLKRPGSFPYPVTVTLDRHGGALSKKMIYCYGMDTNGKIEKNAQAFVLEDRAFGGVAVNPANGPFDNVPVATKDGGPGGIDGGTGGCGCQWANWLGS
ncbi:uncharacterized protein BDZ99DRAFT_393270 [Mytilinidion resinicola]|uniref:Glycoprotease family protein n=1 Tax=Mytilinidion resinicola TaxID=574789 RepID=A0A6A6YG87_9PEZI|nr:uncharacterized protein BDZ99DRAFT_393270 [Mytilinidion resinicola]KAF2806907.1 hypothetical protein BDZ99DRAFT_393270 [Mytilinidion resinicola]